MRLQPNEREAKRGQLIIDVRCSVDVLASDSVRRVPTMKLAEFVLRNEESAVLEISTKGER
jgi:hypothetical protein